MIYNIITDAIYDNDRKNPNDICCIKTCIYSKENNYSIHEHCKIVNTNMTNVYLYYSIFENNTYNNIQLKVDLLRNEYNEPLDICKKFDVSISYNESIKYRYNKIILTKST
jgi:hypothetical protein